MPFKDFNLTENIKLRIVKRRSSKKLKLSIVDSNNLKLSIPYWTPYRVGINFTKSKMEWITKNLPEPVKYHNHQKIGKYHVLELIIGKFKRIQTSLNNNIIRINIPTGISPTDKDLTKKISNAIDKALFIESNNLLKKRTNQIADKYGFQFSSLKFKKLKSKWGSCDLNKSITLNTKLMQLPWDNIDYVIIHELCHLDFMNHSVSFWKKVESLSPNYKELRKQIKRFHY